MGHHRPQEAAWVAMGRECVRSGWIKMYLVRYQCIMMVYVRFLFLVRCAVYVYGTKKGHGSLLLFFGEKL